MEDEATIPEMGTAIDDVDAVDRIAALLDVPEASNEVSEQADEHVEEPVADEAAETPDTEETYLDIDGNQVSLTVRRMDSSSSVIFLGNLIEVFQYLET